MRRPINDVGDILSILRSRSTSKPGDRPIIAALLANVRDVIKLADKSEATLTEEIIRFLGRVPQNALLHGKPTIGNEGEPWDRCPASLDDMPAEIVADMESQRASEIVNTIDVSDDGAVDGEWWYSMIAEADRDKTHPYGDDLLNDTKVKLALEDWERCLILRIPASSKEDAAILVRPMSTEKRQESVEQGDGNNAKESRVWICQYVGAVLDERGARPPRSGSDTYWQPDEPKG
ncbi:hypothetical protein K4K53_001447 [Colletotrichum sp. SAR 10_77]|nr:hypothetical protein K4K51_003841 [Colletotrichum sp. SAR 10_75]KAI8247801.1 hypothetical protein K4K53_001447 [Colletotrichum sp. SAR 10_77]